MPQGPTIPPCTARGDRPTWSVVIPVHECAALLRVSLGAVLDQLAGRDDVEVIVVDDASSDHPETVVDELDTRREVRFERNERALGAVRNFNRCLELTSGEIVHLLHGDDLVLPGFYDAMRAELARGDAVAALCRTQYVDDAGRPGAVTRSERDGTGIWSDALRTLAVSNRVRPSAIVVLRSVYEQVGGFREDLPHAADWEMWARIAAHGPVRFVDEVLAGYRVHDASDTATRIRTGENVRERRVAIRDVAEHVDPALRSRMIRRALAYSALFAGRTGLRALRRRDLRTAGVQLREAMVCLVDGARPSARH